MEKPLNDLALVVKEVNLGNGWNVLQPHEWQEMKYKVPAILMLIVSECAEALEGFRNGDWDNFKEEIADIQIRVLDLAGGLEIDLDEEVAKKLEKNRERGHRHGGKRV